ncbi:xanthine dehydrogenase family Fe-S subunit [Ancylobacter lacus]|uniref:xanthine dehydrogenase family Fe-S subunit n=1 Tax=Ancylobacter lacus TaxID=2579970 RepID=UPI001BCE732F|nr:2Fe-2S iron-sulfur cluster-binding protein [Ancylobacter lacus]MBS7538945.1 2Fe-2S iron-sulfur cluster binding domain-containing protein [Ancylobacter lacus]
MNRVTIEVNGRVLAAEVAPRQHLGDFLREELLLTATHLGCEHGVCGACTVLIDGAPARSCIAFPAMLDGAKITTLEGLSDDPVTAELRAAFTAEHGLQCGFCTPGMLIMARDIVLRRPGADEEAIRHELAGNLCRCTGYVGIVRAVRAVAAARAGLPAEVTRGLPVPAPAYVSPLALPEAGALAPAGRAAPAAAPPSAPPPSVDEKSLETLKNPVRLEQRFTVPAGVGAVWDFFQRPEAVVACLPGARLVAPSDGTRFEAEMTVKLGPMQAAFRGAGTIAADAASYTGTLRGQGVDSRSASRVQAELVYRLEPAGVATAVHVDIAYALQGPLAQMSRGAIARDLAGRLTVAFAQNLAAALAGAGAPAAPAPLDGGGLLLAMVKDWLGRLFRRRG